MRDNADIIRELQEQAKYYYAEGEKRERAAAILSEGLNTLPVTGTPNAKFPDYQPSWEALEKIKYFEAIHHRFWPLSIMEELLIDLEGKEKGSLSFLTLRSYVYRAVTLKQIVKLKYEGTRAVFYSTHQEWVEHYPEDAVPYRVIEHYAPDPTYLKRLTAEQIAPEKVRWEGIA